MATTTAYTHLSPRVEVLDNGMRVALEHLPYLHSASVGVWIKTGSANERPEIAGISHFLEHLFFKGTKTRTARELMDAIESRGGQMNAFTSREYTCLYVKTLDRHVATAIEILADVLKNSIYADLEKERNVILEEIASAIDVPEDYVHDVLSQHIWPDHSLGKPVAGFEETVSTISLDDVSSYKKAWYRPENMYFCIAGRFDEDAVLAQVREAFDGIETGPAETRFGVPAWNSGPKLVERDIAQDHLLLAFPGPTIVDPRRHAYDVLTSVLGGGSTSRLFERIREDAGLAYSIYAFHSGYLTSGMLGVYAAIAPENLQQALDLCCVEMRDLCEKSIEAGELESNAEQLKGGLLLALEGTFNRMARMGRSLMYFDRLVPVEEVLENVDSVTADDLRSLAESVFTASNCAITILGPSAGDAPRLALS